MEALQSKLNEIYQRALEKHDRALRDYIIKNLKEFGININTDEALNEFAKKRITEVQYEDEYGYKDQREIYLDYGTDDQRIIGIYSTKISVDFNYDESTINVKVGG